MKAEAKGRRNSLARFPSNGGKRRKRLEKFFLDRV